MKLLDFKLPIYEHPETLACLCVDFKSKEKIITNV